MVLKIKNDKIRELINYGFNDIGKSYIKYDTYTYYRIDKKDNIITLSHKYEDFTIDLETLFNLIKADLVEKVNIKKENKNI